MNIYAILGPLEVCLEKMNIQDFFDKSDKLPDLPSQATQFEEIAHELKTRAKWQCSTCKKDFTQSKNMLGVFHKNGNKDEDTVENLVVMCKECAGEKGLKV